MDERALEEPAQVEDNCSEYDCPCNSDELPEEKFSKANLSIQAKWKSSLEATWFQPPPAQEDQEEYEELGQDCSAEEERARCGSDGQLSESEEKEMKKDKKRGSLSRLHGFFKSTAAGLSSRLSRRSKPIADEAEDENEEQESEGVEHLEQCGVFDKQTLEAPQKTLRVENHLERISFHASREVSTEKSLELVNATVQQCADFLVDCVASLERVALKELEISLPQVDLSVSESQFESRFDTDQQLLHLERSEEESFEWDLWRTWVSKLQVPCHGKWYYEVEIYVVEDQVAQVGWAADSFKIPPRHTGKGVGDCENSWSFDGCRQLLWHREDDETWGEDIRNSTSRVIGCAVDFESRTISFSMDGSWAASMGVAFRDFAFPQGSKFAPAVSGDGTFVVNLGFTSFRFNPPSDDYLGVATQLIMSEGPLLASRDSLLGESNGMSAALSNRPGVLNLQATGTFQTWVLPHVAVSSGKWYYEVTLENISNIFQIGWANEKFRLSSSDSGAGIGDCLNSWAYDAYRVCLWSGRRTTPWGRQYDPAEKRKRSVVIGCAIDLENGVISFSYDGSFELPMGVAFSNDLGYRRRFRVDKSKKEFFFPGVTGKGSDKFQVNLGKVAFAGQPPAGHRALWEAVSCSPPNTRSPHFRRQHSEGLERLKFSRLGHSAGLVPYLLDNPWMRFSALTSFSLQDCNLSVQALGQEMLDKFCSGLCESCPRLREIRLEGCGLEPRSLSALVPLLVNAEIVILDRNRLSGNAGGMEVAKVVTKSRRLGALSLKENDLGDVGGSLVLNTIANVRGCRVEHLSLAGNGLAEKSASALGRLAKKKYSLKTLDVSKNPRVFHPMASHLSSTPGLRLYTLDLSWCDFGGDEDEQGDIDKLCTMLHSFPDVGKLALNGSLLSGDAAVRLAKRICSEFPQLQALYLADVDFSESDLDQALDWVLSSRASSSSLRFLDLSCASASQLGEALELSAVAILQSRLCDENAKSLSSSSFQLPCVRFRSSKSKQHLSYLLEAFMVDLARTNAKDLEKSLLRLFEREWIFDEAFSSLATTLHRWALDVGNGLDESSLPTVRFQGDLIVEKGRAKEFPSLVHVMGSAFLDRFDFGPCLDTVTIFLVDKDVWVRGCVSFGPFSRNLSVGSSLRVEDCDVNNVQLHPKDPDGRLNIVEFVGLASLTYLPDTAPMSHLVLQDCPSIQALPDSLQVSCSLVVQRCESLAMIPACTPKDLTLDDCTNLTDILATPTRRFSACSCPRLQVTPCGVLEDVELLRCDNLEVLRLAPTSKLMLVNCPRVSWELEDFTGETIDVEELELNKAILTSIPDHVSVSSCKVTYSECETLPSCFSKVSSCLELRHCNQIKSLPVLSKVQELTVCNCSGFESLENQLLPPRSDQEDEDEDEDEDNDNEAKKDKSTRGCLESIVVSRCDSFRSLPGNGCIQELTLRECPNLVSVPGNLDANYITISDCAALQYFGGLDENSIIHADVVELESCTSLETIAWLEVEDLNVVDCPRLRTVAPHVESQSFTFMATGLQDIPDELIQEGRTISADMVVPVERLAALEALAESVGCSLEFEASLVDDFECMLDAVLFWEEEAQVEPDELRHCLQDVVPPYYELGVRRFFSMLRQAAEFNRSETRVGLATCVIEVMDLILRHAYAREEVLTRLSDSVDRCDDKPVWALNQVMLTAKIARARGDREKLREIGHAIMRLGVVHAHAAAKVKSLGPRVDDVCVYLKFEVDLREKLDLPTIARRMIFENLFNISQAELDAACQEALAISEEDVDVWLENWPEWQRQLRLEASNTLHWSQLARHPKPKRVSANLTSFSGSEILEPVMLGKSGPYDFGELMDRWVSTGMDFSNVTWPIEKFKQYLMRVDLVVE